MKLLPYLILAAILIPSASAIPDARTVVPTVGVQDVFCSVREQTCGAVVLASDCQSETSVLAAAVTLPVGQPVLHNYRAFLSVFTDGGFNVTEYDISGTDHPIWNFTAAHPAFLHQAIASFEVQDLVTSEWVLFARSSIITC